MKLYTLLLALVLLTGCSDGGQQVSPSSESEETIVETQSRIIPIPDAAEDYKSVRARLTADKDKAIYSHDEWFDLDLVLVNLENNPGSVVFTVEAIDKEGAVHTPWVSEPVPAGSAWNPPLIASAYKWCTVYANAVDAEGDYTLKFGPAPEKA